jgi:HEAT repeat protein
MKIASDKNINIRIRNTAVEVLSRKNAPELVDYFIEMLGDPETNEEMLSFVNNAMGNIQNDRMTMALLESFQTGKNRYYASLHSIMSAMDEYNNPQIKPTFIEIATTEGFPRLLRVKAINSLANFNDTQVLDYIVPILENPDNYEFYFDVLNLANRLNANEQYMNAIRNAAYNAMLNSSKNIRNSSSE